MNKTEYLTNAIQARTEEIERFNLDISTNQRVVDTIGQDPALQEYKAHMERVIAFSQLEKRKAELHKTALEAELQAQ
jgi:hypothetical protein